MEILGLTEWYKEKDKQLLKETSLVFYYFEEYKIIRYSLTSLWFLAMYLSSIKWVVALLWVLFAIIFVSYSFYIQCKIDKQKPTPEKSLEEYIRYRNTTNFPIT